MYEQIYCKQEVDRHAHILLQRVRRKDLLEKNANDLRCSETCCSSRSASSTRVGHPRIRPQILLHHQPVLASSAGAPCQALPVSSSFSAWVAVPRMACQMRSLNFSIVPFAKHMFVLPMAHLASVDFVSNLKQIVLMVLHLVLLFVSRVGTFALRCAVRLVVR
jgi:hypothetical protein